MGNDNLLLCYNRGCGQKYDPATNTEESCRHHTGYPVFHDAYKGWSCCKKKCTDFTEFLNIKGCRVGEHSNVKPPEPPKPPVDKETADQVVYVKTQLPLPITTPPPPIDSPLVTLKVDVTPALQEIISNFKSCSTITNDEDCSNSDDNIPLGTQCKNNACKTSYESPESLTTDCIHHPGYPVFHEGLKFWTCCTKRTTDFETFLAQPGCTVGEHVWFKKKKAAGEARCRLDWHQTPSHVYVSVFAKEVDPRSSLIQLSPVRLRFSLGFPEQTAAFSKDIHLRGVVDVERSEARMSPSKVEIKLGKRDARSWPGLEIPPDPPHQSSQPQEEPLDAVDLSSI